MPSALATSIAPDLLFGLQVAVVGMSLVFGLLAMLWLILSILTQLDRPASPAPAAVRIESTEELDDDAVAAITIAVVAHADARRRQAAPAMRSTWPGSQMYASRWMASGRTRQTRFWERKR